MGVKIEKERLIMNKNEKRYVESVAKKYSTKEITKLDQLKELDKSSRRGAMVFAYVFGSISSLVMGFGMCVAMEVILKGWMWLGIVVGVIGMGLCAANYFIYRKLEEKGKNRNAAKILELSKELLNEND